MANIMSYFNSTMVRLKVLRFVRQKLFSVFQFHYGTIKRFWFVQCLLVVLLFQFHYGTIKSLTQMNDNVQHATFQFHYGTIKRWLQRAKRRLLRISIPLWYD